jgi:hypothetical protein
MLTMLFALLLSAQPMLRPTPMEVAAAMMPTMQADSPGALITVQGSSSEAVISVRGDPVFLVGRTDRIYSTSLMDKTVHLLASDQTWPRMYLTTTTHPGDPPWPIPDVTAALFDREYARLLEQQR